MPWGDCTMFVSSKIPSVWRRERWIPVVALSDWNYAAGITERQENLYDYGRIPNQKNGPQLTEAHLINYVGFGLVTAAATAAATAATAAAAATPATASAAASTGEHGVVDHKPNLSTQVLDVINGCLFQEGGAV